MSIMLPKTTVIQGCFNSIKKTWQNLYGTLVGSIPKICDLVSHGYSLYLKLVKDKK